MYLYPGSYSYFYLILYIQFPRDEISKSLLTFLNYTENKSVTDCWIIFLLLFDCCSVIQITLVTCNKILKIKPDRVRI
jgi:hypothetical protein